MSTERLNRNESFGIMARPHPNPPHEPCRSRREEAPFDCRLPIADCRLNSQSLLTSAATVLSRAGNVTPSPWGEGWGEGGRGLSTEWNRLCGVPHNRTSPHISHSPFMIAPSFARRGGRAAPVPFGRRKRARPARGRALNLGGAPLRASKKAAPRCTETR